MVKVAQEDNLIRVGVVDQGKGIDPRYQKRIFERYFQVLSSNLTGTGLAISKEFIQAQDGEIGVASAPRMGSTFFFYLPV